MGGYAEQLVYGLLLLLIFSVLANLHFINHRLQKKISEKKRQKQLPSQIKKFLIDQCQKTQTARNNKQRNHISKGVVKLRYAYLSIEAKAIDKEIDSTAYWNLINHNVQKLLDALLEQRTSKPLKDIEEKINLIKTKIAQSGNTKNAERVLASLEKFHTACVENSKNPEKIAHYNEKLEELMNKLGNAAYRNVTEKTKIHDDYIQKNHESLKNLKLHTLATSEIAKSLENVNADNFDFTLNCFNKNQAQLIESVEKYEDNIAIINRGNKNANTAIITSTNNGTYKVNNELNELSDRIQEENEKEIERLREIIKEQKNIIFELEKDIEKPKNSGIQQKNQKKDQHDNVNQLKNILRESELCIDTLENELDNLRKHHNHHNDDPKEEPVTAPLTENNLRSLEETISRLKNEVSEAQNNQKFHKAILNFIAESLDANSAEDISLSTFQTLEDLGWKSGLMVNSGLRILEIDPEGLLKERERTLIHNMQIGEVNSQKNNSQVKFHYMNISGKIVAQDHTSNTHAEKHASILSVLQAADKIVEKMKSVHSLKHQKKQLQESTNNIKKLAVEVDSTLEAINKRTQESIRNGFGQIQDIAHSKGLKGSQIASFKNLEQQTLNELSADHSLRLKIKKQFLLVLKTLDDF